MKLTAVLDEVDKLILLLRCLAGRFVMQPMLPLTRFVAVACDFAPNTD